MLLEADQDVSKNRVPQNGWFVMENPIKMDDLGVPLFLETPIRENFRGFRWFWKDHDLKFQVLMGILKKMSSFLSNWFLNVSSKRTCLDCSMYIYIY